VVTDGVAISGIDCNDEQLENMVFIVATRGMLNLGIVFKELHPENIRDVLVQAVKFSGGTCFKRVQFWNIEVMLTTLDVLSSGIDSRAAQAENMLVQSVAADISRLTNFSCDKELNLFAQLRTAELKTVYRSRYACLTFGLILAPVFRVVISGADKTTSKNPLS